MKLFFSTRQLDHRPQQMMRLGRLIAPVETPDRPEALASRLVETGMQSVAPEDHGRTAIVDVHSHEYVAFLESAYERWRAMPEAGPEVLPNTHPFHGAGSPRSREAKLSCTAVAGQAGWFIGDLNCAIGEGTWFAAYDSAQTAISAARSVLAGAPSAFALSRPPGHHAYRDRASGFCFLNNAAIAAELLANTFGNVAVVDFDTHHGDGTQAIFYHRANVLFASVHTDPAVYYPYYSGYADERGAGAGEGATLNVPLAVGSGDAAFLDACRALAAAVRVHGSNALIVSAGWDAHRDDPLSMLDVTTEAFARVGEILAELRLPTLVVQEGGYSLTASMAAASRFVEGFSSRHSAAHA